MNTQTDLSDVIEDSITDAELPLEEPDLDTSSEVPEASPEPTTTASELSIHPEDSAVPEAPEVRSPAARSTDPAKTDDFEKRFGIPQNSVSGRENRIPYSRVKKITQKAENEAAERVKGEYVPKITEFETKLKDYETKVTDYEGRLTKVAEFERIMMNDPVKFVGMLTQIPEYAKMFAPLYEQAIEEPKAPVVDPSAEPRPEPDMTLADGSKAYSMEGLDKLNTWNRNQAAAEARKQVMAEVEKEFGPIRDKARAQERLEAAIPKVQAQIAEARKWPKFTENEVEITKALQSDEDLTLEGAYNRVVVPKLAQVQTEAQLSADELKKKIRAEVIAELKQTPRSTSASTGSGKPAQRSSAGPRSLESVIEEAMQTLKK